MIDKRVRLGRVYIRLATHEVVVVSCIIGVDIAELDTRLQFVTFGERPGIICLKRIDIDRAGQIDR
jgi:hypothetical protein